MGHKRYAAASFLILLLALSSAHSGGFTFDGIGVKAQGMGGAFRAVADDWSAAYYNPAGYGWIQDNMLSGNLALFHNRYYVTPEFKWGGQFASGYYNDIRLPNSHAIHNVPQVAALIRLPVANDEMVFGFSIIQSFDQNLDWTTVFGFHDIEMYGMRDIGPRQFYNNFDVVDAQLTAARTFLDDDKLSVGLGIGLRRVDLKFSNLVLRRNPLLDNPDFGSYVERPYERVPQWYENDGNGYGFCYRLGLMYAINEKTKVGLTYSGKSTITVDGSGTSVFFMGDNASLLSNNTLWTEVTEQYHFFAGENFTNMYDFKADVDVPAVFGGGISYQFNERLLLAADFEYVLWSQFKGFEFKSSNYSGVYDDFRFANFTYLNDSLMRRDISYPVKWDDAMKFMAGANYQVNGYTQARVGFAYDQSPISEMTLTPHFVDLGNKITFSAGLSFDIEVWRVEIAGTYTHHPDLTVGELDEVNGDDLIDNFPGLYEANTFQTVLGFTYRF